MRLEITQRADLAVRALRALAPDERRKASSLAAELGASAGFLTQALTPLVRAGWITSTSGPTGGYALSGAAPTLLQVIEAVDGPTDDGRCAVAGACDPAHPCALHDAWASARASLMTTLDALPARP